MCKSDVWRVLISRVHVHHLPAAVTPAVVRFFHHIWNVALQQSLTDSCSSLSSGLTWNSRITRTKDEQMEISGCLEKKQTQVCVWVHDKHTLPKMHLDKNHRSLNLLWILTGEKKLTLQFLSENKSVFLDVFQDEFNNFYTSFCLWITCRSIVNLLSEVGGSSDGDSDRAPSWSDARSRWMGGGGSVVIRRILNSFFCAGWGVGGGF